MRRTRFLFSLEFYRFVLFGVGETTNIRPSPARDIVSLMSALLNPVGNHKMGEKWLQKSKFRVRTARTVQNAAALSRNVDFDVIG